MTAPLPNVDPSVLIGSGTSISPSATIGASVTLADGVDVGPGAVLVGPLTVGAGVSIASGVVIDADASATGDPLAIQDDVVIASGATIVGRIAIARGAHVSAGAVVQRDVPPYAIVAGNPAEIVGYALSEDGAARDQAQTRPSREPGVTEAGVRGVTLHNLPRILDLRGNLTVGEFGRSIPFEAKRYFMVFGVPNAEIRGEHAHRTCKQFLICARGSCSVVVDDGTEREEYLLDDPATGIFLPAMTWGIQYKYSPDAVLLVFASEFYDSGEYIRDYTEFAALAAERAE